MDASPDATLVWDQLDSLDRIPLRLTKSERCELRHAVAAGDGWLFVIGYSGGGEYEFAYATLSGRPMHPSTDPTWQLVAYSDAGYGGIAGCLRDGLIYVEGGGGTFEMRWSAPWEEHIARFVKIRNADAAFPLFVPAIKSADANRKERVAST